MFVSSPRASHHSRRALALWWTIAFSSCLIYGEDLLVDGEGGAGAAGAAGGASAAGGEPASGGGGMVACTSADTCPGQDPTCGTRVCVDGSCDIAYAPDGADPDNECGADACNGQGQCRCADGVLSGNESDVDCGGAACPKCVLGDDCNTGADCVSMSCVAGTCAGVCGDNSTSGGEQCDDGNTDDFDGCSPQCLNPTTHLVLSEFVVQPTTDEFVEIFNPTGAAISLSNVWIADYKDYHLVTTGGMPVTSDFAVRFPSGASIAAGAFVVVSTQPAATFQATYGMAPDFDFGAMLGNAGLTASLTNTGEMIVLFEWNGVSATVTDIDYVVYGNTTSAMDKSGVAGYVAETPAASQIAGATPDANGHSLHRCDTAEASETKSGGNGTSGHDETSESGTAAWKETLAPTPKAAPPVGFCP